MTGAQKEDIFNLLKAASSCNLGYEAKAFKTVPSFTDDPALPQTQAKEAAVAEAKSPLSIGSIAQKIQACKNCSLAATRH
ncbi:MAG: uracil-DNA glycosylase, partial [Treponema sp.]|nr:uracil-DNA glycosylase [Treponema sp.]